MWPPMDACDCEAPVGIAMALVVVVALVLGNVDIGTIVWLLLSSVHKLIWSVPVIGTEITVNGIHHAPRLLYTRQIYVNVEIAFLGLLRRCVVEPPEFIKVVTTLYLWSAIAISIGNTSNSDAVLYKMHDAFGLVVAAIWFYRATQSAVKSA